MRKVIPGDKDVLYARSLHEMKCKLETKSERGWKLKGEIKEQLDGKFACQIIRDTPWVFWD